MTMTVKLDPVMESTLRARSAALGRPASELIREALQVYLAASPASATSAFALGADLFGRHAGAPDLATDRRRTVADAWDEKHRALG